MTARELTALIEEKQGYIAEKEWDLAYKVNRVREINARPTTNKQLKSRIVSRYKTEIKQLTDELNNLKIELWGLQELNLPEA